jgi:hypothetical protein
MKCINVLTGVVIYISNRLDYITISDVVIHIGYFYGSDKIQLILKRDAHRYSGGSAPLLTEFTRSILSNQVQISNFAKLGSNWLKKTCGPKP